MTEHRIDSHTIELREEVFRTGYSRTFDPNYQVPSPYSTATTYTNNCAPPRKQPDRTYYRRTFGK